MTAPTPDTAAERARDDDYERGYYGHGRGVVVTQPRPGEFEERLMTAGELAAREPAWAIGADPYEFLTSAAAFAYHRAWSVIAPAMDAALRAAEAGARCAALEEAAKIAEGIIVSEYSAGWRGIPQAIRALASSPAAASPWREIASAPKDGDEIIGWDGDSHWVCWHSHGWWTERGPVHPTHWMPLPDPPAPSPGRAEPQEPQP